MKRSSLAAASIIITVGFSFGLSLFLNQTKGPYLHSRHVSEMSGQVSDVYLNGGRLQQNLGDAVAEEFISIETSSNAPAFVQNKFTVHANRIISVTLHNRSGLKYQHTWVLVQPDTQDKLASEAKSAGPQSHWIPNSPDILAFVPLTDAGQSNTVLFHAPSKPGDYPFICTFPGHGEAMQGTLHVVE